MAKDTVGAAQCSSSAGEGTGFSTNPQSCIISYYINISKINVRVVSVLVYVDPSLCACACVHVHICSHVYVPVCMSLYVCLCVHMSQVFSDTEAMTYTGQELLEQPNHDTKLGRVKIYI